MATKFDVVIVGARCAGAATALLLARAGARVLVVDKGVYGSDTVSTHALMRGAVLQLHPMGRASRGRRCGDAPGSFYDIQLHQPRHHCRDRAATRRRCAVRAAALGPGSHSRRRGDGKRRGVRVRRAGPRYSDGRPRPRARHRSWPPRSRRSRPHRRRRWTPLERRASRRRVAALRRPSPDRRAVRLLGKSAGRWLLLGLPCVSERRRNPDQRQRVPGLRLLAFAALRRDGPWRRAGRVSTGDSRGVPGSRREAGGGAAGRTRFAASAGTSGSSGRAQEAAGRSWATRHISRIR